MQDESRPTVMIWLVLKLKINCETGLRSEIFLSFFFLVLTILGRSESESFLMTSGG